MRLNGIEYSPTRTGKCSVCERGLISIGSWEFNHKEDKVVICVRCLIFLFKKLFKLD